MKIKLLNIIVNFIICILLLTIILVDESSLKFLYFSYDDTFVISEVNTGERNDSIIYNEVNVPRVSMMSSNVDKWVWPTESNYMVTNGFSWYHNALDIAGGYGSQIYAANSGVVTMVMGGCSTGNLSCNGRGGNYIVVKHNTGNYYTVYMHLKDILVSVGQTVGSGQVVGTMGNTGNVYPVPSSSNPYAGTHLHYGY